MAAVSARSMGRGTSPWQRREISQGLRIGTKEGGPQKTTGRSHGSYGRKTADGTER